MRMTISIFKAGLALNYPNPIFCYQPHETFIWLVFYFSEMDFFIIAKMAFFIYKVFLYPATDPHRPYRSQPMPCPCRTCLRIDFEASKLYYFDHAVPPDGISMKSAGSRIEPT